jgi:hypothetical protein
MEKYKFILGLLLDFGDRVSWPRIVGNGDVVCYVFLLAYAEVGDFEGYGID